MDGRYILSCTGVVYGLSAQEVYLFHSAIFKFGISKGDFHCGTRSSSLSMPDASIGVYWSPGSGVGPVYTDHCLSRVFVFDLQRLDGD